MAARSDDELLTELFEKAVADHGKRLLVIARAIVAHRASPEDVVQQALLNLFQHRHRYDWREPGGLMRRTVVNEALRILRQPRIAPVEDEMPERRHSEPGLPLERAEKIAAVRQAISQLPDHFRAALVLCEYEQLSYQQIADLLGASIPQVKTWLHRGRLKLASLLAEHAPEEKTA